MKLLQSLWGFTDNDAMDVTQIDVSTSATHDTLTPDTEQPAPLFQAKYDYSNIINLLDYMKVKNHAY